MLVSFENPGLLHIFSKKARRSSLESSKVARSCARWRNPLGEVFSVLQIVSKSARELRLLVGVIGALLSGVHQLAVRWYTVREATWSAMAGISCTPLDPVPMTATRLPAKSTGVERPQPGVVRLASKVLAAGHLGEVRHREDAGGGDQEPSPEPGTVARRHASTARTTRRTRPTSPSAPNRMWRRRSNRSTTWLR